MSTEAKQKWMEYKADKLIMEFDMACFSLLPPAVQKQVRELARRAIEDGYNSGFNEGRATLSGRPPSFSIPAPVLEIVIELNDSA